MSVTCVFACSLKTPNMRWYRPELSYCATAQDKGKAVPLQACSGPEGSRKLRFPDFVTTAQDGGRLSALRTGRLYLQEILLVHEEIQRNIQ